MTDPRTRARQLVELANSSHSEEERRTAAVTAARLIKRHDLLTPPAPPRRRFWQWGDTTATEAAEEPPAPPRPPPRGVWTRVDRGGWCAGCRERFHSGDRVYVAGGAGVWCGRCA